MRLAPYRALKGGGYSARSGRYPCAGIVPTKGAAGATFTASRGGGSSSFGKPDAPAYLLRRFGTCDDLRGGLRFWRPRPLVERGKCTCCGGPAKFRLTDKGRARLAALRRARFERLARAAGWHRSPAGFFYSGATPSSALA